MPFTMFEEAEGLRVALTGFAVPFEFLEVAQATAAHPGRDGHLYHIFDFTDIDGNSLFALTDAVGGGHAPRSREIFGDRRNPWLTALVSPQAKMQDVFQAFMDGDPRPPGHLIQRFRTLVQARDWIRDRLSAGRPGPEAPA